MFKKLFLFALMCLAPSLLLAQVATLTDTTHSLTIITSAAPATTNPTYSVSWKGTGGPADAVGSTTSTTAVTMLTGGTAGPREVHTIHVYNADTAAITVRLAKVISGTSFNQVSGTIPVGGTLRWSETGGVSVLDSQGVPATAATGTVVTAIGATAAESGAGTYRRTTITLVNTVITMRDTEQGGGQKVYDFPEGRVFILGANANLTMTTTSVIASTLNSGVTCNWGVGTTTQASATVATTEQDLIPVTAWTSGTTINVANTATRATLAAAAQFDGTTTPIDAYMNLAVAGATDIDANATVAVNGTITIHWVLLGDY